MNYVTRTLKKLKEEVLGKVIYDLVKYGFGVIFSLIAGGTYFGWFDIVIALPLWALLFTIFSAVQLTSAIWAKIAAAKLKPLVVSNRTDQLTQLLNTNALQEDLIVAIIDARKQNQPLSIILLDIDDFKLFNTQYNSIVADHILSKLGELLMFDKRITDTIYRQHTRGDEFVIITRNTSLTYARIAAERKHKTIASIGLRIDGQRDPLNLTVCCAIVELASTDTKGSLLERASEVMKQAKRYPGKNRIEAVV